MPLTRMRTKALLVCLITGVWSSLSGAQAPRPNIVFILTDDLGYGDLGMFWQNARKEAADPREPWHSTPNLDELARKGAMLRHHYCPAPVCAPSRASLLLGVNQGHANIRDNQFDKALENNHTLATVLKRAGYATAAIGKYGLQGGGHNPVEWPAYPTKRGFDYYFGYARHRDGHEHYPKEGTYRGRKECYDGLENITPSLDKCYTADLFSARAKVWISDQVKRDPHQPFFLYLAFDTPHAVLELPTQAYPSGGGLRGGLQWLGIPGKMINTASGTVDSYYHPDYADATWQDGEKPNTPWPDAYKRYATSVRRIDDCIGDLQQLLRDLGIDQNTLIVFTSDNGPSQESYLEGKNEPNFFKSFGPFEGIKRDVWEGGLRLPTIAHWPARIPSGRVDDTPSGLWDWMATFAEVAGVPTPARSDGVSLIPALTGSGQQRASNVYIEYAVRGTTPNYGAFSTARHGRTRNQMQAVRIGNYMGVRYDVKAATDNFEIYDVVSDPRQLVDLAKRAANLDRSPTTESSENDRFAALQKQMQDRALQSRRASADAPRPYDRQSIPSVSAPAVSPGLEWRAYFANFPWVPEFDHLNASDAGVTPKPALSVTPQRSDLGLSFVGFLKIPSDGEYTFHLATDNRAVLRIHGATVLDADFGYGFEQPSEVTASIVLKAGLHPFRLYYVRGSSESPTLDLKWSGPGMAKTLIGAESFYRTALGPREHGKAGTNAP